MTSFFGRYAALGFVAIALLGGCGDGGGNDSAPPPPPEAGIITVRAESVPLVVELAGRIAAYETSEVRPQVTGLVQRRFFEEGANVRAGQTLYRIDPRLYRAAADEARADLASAEATRVAAEARARRFAPLARIEAVSQQDYADAVATAGQAAAAVRQSRAALDAATTNLRFTEVAAPISGRIGRSLATVGALATANQAEPLAVIQRLDPIFVDMQQSSAELLALRRSLARDGVVPSSAQVRLILEDGSAYDRVGTVQFSEVQADPATGVVTLRARFANPDGLLLPGMYARARLSQETVTRAWLVPQAAVTRDPQGRATVLVLGQGDRAVPRRVRTERTAGDRWIVTEGLNDGDRVIVEGLGRIDAGDVVRPVRAGAPRPTPPQGADEEEGDRGG